MPEGRTDLYDRLAAERGPNLEHIFLALANAPDLAEAVLGLATALRKKTTLSRVFRELAVITVGLETDAQYEVEHPDLGRARRPADRRDRSCPRALCLGSRSQFSTYLESAPFGLFRVLTGECRRADESRRAAQGSGHLEVGLQ